MARSRNIKPSFFKNEHLIDLQPLDRLLFIGLWTLADREGRLEDRPRRIKIELFPGDSYDVETGLANLAGKGFIERYEVDSEQYIQIEAFTKHQKPHHKEIASDIPAPPGRPQVTRHAYDVSSETRLSVFERDGNRCLKCGAEEGLSLDHIQPLAKGGDNSTENLQTLCTSCNSAKGDTTKDYRRAVDDSSLSRVQGNDGAPCPSDSLSLDSLSLDSLNLIPDSLPPLPPEGGAAAAAGKQVGKYSADFELFWREYPKRHRASPKPDAWKAWQARIRAGVPSSDLIAAAMAYRKEQVALGKAGTQYVQQPATFLGPGERWTPYLGPQPEAQAAQLSAVLSVPTHSQEMYPDDKF